MSKLRAFINNQNNIDKLSMFVNKYSNLLKEVKYSTSQESNYFKKIKSMNSTFSSEGYIFNSSKTNHIQLYKEPVEFAGKNLYTSNLFVRDEPLDDKSLPTVRIANSEESLSSNSFVIGGISGDEVKQISALLKTAKILISKSGSSDICTPLAIYPEVSRVDRYNAVKEYNNNPEFVPNYIKSRVETHILPRIIDNLDLNSRENIISLLSFSMGGREIMMMQTALRNILENDLSISEKIVDIAMSDIRTVSIGYAPNLNAFESVGFNKIIIFSLDDRGVLLPKDLCAQALVKKSVLGKTFSVKAMHKEFDPFQYLIIDGVDQANAKNEILQDHTIANYLDFIETLPEDMQQVIGDCVNCCE